MAKDAVAEIAPVLLIGGAIFLFRDSLGQLLSTIQRKANQVTGATHTPGGAPNQVYTIPSSGTSGAVAVAPPPAAGGSQALVIGLQHIYAQGTAAPTQGVLHEYPQAGYIGANGQATNTGTVYTVYAMSDGSYTLIPA